MDVVEVPSRYLSNDRLKFHLPDVLRGLQARAEVGKLFVISESEDSLEGNNELIRAGLRYVRDQGFNGALGDRVIIDRSTEAGALRGREALFRDICGETGISERHIIYASQNQKTSLGFGEFPSWIFFHEWALRMGDAYRDLEIGQGYDLAERKVLCLNSKIRPHRIATVLAAEKVLGDDLIFSWRGKSALYTWESALEEFHRDFPEIVSGDFSILNEKSRNFIANIPNSLGVNIESSERCFLHLVCESDYLGWSSRFTEKILKPIACRRPFLVMGPTSVLKTLKALGFRTFSEVFDESYDNEVGHQNRLNKVMESLKDIYSRDHVDFLMQCKEVCEHNNVLLRNGLNKRISEIFEHDLLKLMRSG